ncbi:MAG: GTP cyclohydrolase I, partial [Planctomycetota bacterium]|nr:GTP cyclohydrolase I [Planctomycetota bacterium]
MSTRTGDLSPLIADLLSGIGEDPSREGLVDTPERVDKSLKYLTKGYAEDPVEVLNDALFTEDYNEMVVVKNIKIFSLCEHHMLPFVGVAHVAYLPDGKIVFVSSRCNRWVQCWLTKVAVLHRCDADGSNIRAISANLEHDNTPWPMPDGRVL